jgi:hypothetical protein
LGVLFLSHCTNMGKDEVYKRVYEIPFFFEGTGLMST